ncbi:probable 26S proteasome non-ATPase regulatory subunit 9 [Vanessa cardui]|uniref:probable 26S proteasome non-ATPase regulatory subunit 9 n=1 Tax=Vanessa cardui TaxID=171605 RepID=UPI001F12DE26|nr:probable 26S proteasome non-ATPase regulatory subunit 9 [Vanessa cardui]
MVRRYIEETEKVKKPKVTQEIDFYKPFSEMTSDELKQNFEEIVLRHVCFTKMPKQKLPNPVRRHHKVPLNDILNLEFTDPNFQSLLFGENAINGDETYEELETYAHNDNPPKVDDFSNDVFATIHNVAEGSPAHDGGLRENDKLIQFDYINVGNYSDIFQLRKIVKESIYKDIKIQVRRGDEKVWLVVAPRYWEKPGLIGCQIMSHWGQAKSPRWALPK